MLTQSPASHKTSFQAERAPSLLDSYPGLRFKFNVREEKERGIKPAKPNTGGRKASTGMRSLNLLRQKTTH